MNTTYKIFIIIGFYLTIIVSSANAQQSSSYPILERGILSLSYNHIKNGSPYLYDSFEKGSVEYRNRVYPDIYININGHANEVHIKRADSDRIIVLNTSYIDTFIIGLRNYKVIDGKIYEVLFDSDDKLLKRGLKVFYEKVNPGDNTITTGFQEYEDIFYVVKGRWKKINRLSDLLSELDYGNDIKKKKSITSHSRKDSIYVRALKYGSKIKESVHNNSEDNFIKIVTNRDTYVAGEQMWISASTPSSRSTAYVEIYRSQQIVASCKINLENGRGGGVIKLPDQLSSGYYTLVAYTKETPNHKYAIHTSSIPILNSSIKVDDQETYKEDSLSRDLISFSVSDQTLSRKDIFETNNNLLIEYSQKVSPNKNVSLKVTNLSDRKKSFAISIDKKDNLVFKVDSSELNYTYNSIPNVLDDSKGEVITFIVKDADNNIVPNEEFILSVPGDIVNVFIARTDSDGIVQFSTNSTPPNSELFIESINHPEKEFVYSLLQSFISVEESDFKTISISPKMYNALLDRCFEVEVAKNFGLYNQSYRNVFLYDDFSAARETLSYNLNDYTRFSTMKDVFIEIIPQLRYNSNTNSIQAYIYSGLNRQFFSMHNCLTLIDGIPIIDHKKVMNFNPLNIGYIDIIQRNIIIGNLLFSGIVNLKTKNSNYKEIPFSKSTYTIDFQGTQDRPFPLNIDLSNNNIPNIRSVLYWNPVIELEPGESREILFQTPSATGVFEIKIL